MLYESEELDLYHNYLLFVRRKAIDEYNLDVRDLMDLEIDLVSKVKEDYLFKFIYYLPYSKRKTALIFRAISYERWKLMNDRDQKLSQLI